MVEKHNGLKLELLSLSSFKQIGGRAGRFVLNGENTPGVVTALSDAHLPVIRKALELPIEPLRYARLSPNKDMITRVAEVLPPHTPLKVAYGVFKYVSKLHPSYELESIDKHTQHLDLIDSVAGSLTIADRLLLLMAPVGWRDELVVRAVIHMVEMYSTKLHVDYKKMLGHCDFLTLLDDVTSLMESGSNQVADNMMQGLEALHKTLTVYVWMSFRQPVAYPDREEVEKLVDKVETAMNWCLDRVGIPTSSNRRVYPVQYGAPRAPIRKHATVKPAFQNKDFYKGRRYEASYNIAPKQYMRAA